MAFDRKAYNFEYRNKYKDYYKEYNKNYQRNNTETVNNCTRRYYSLNRKKQTKEPIIEFEVKKTTIYFE